MSDGDEHENRPAVSPLGPRGPQDPEHREGPERPEGSESAQGRERTEGREHAGGSAGLPEGSVPHAPRVPHVPHAPARTERAPRDLQARDGGTPGSGQAPPGRRADAVRNRAQILAAAERLFGEQDPRTVTMGQLAKAAGVGRATLYRRFPDIPSVAVALLDEHEAQLQGRLVYGPPPLGPGAPPAERLAAFYRAGVELLERHLPLVLGAETGSARFATGAYGFWRVHVRTLLADARFPDPDAVIDTVLGPLAPELYQFQRETLGLSAERITRGLERTARRLLEPAAGD